MTLNYMTVTIHGDVFFSEAEPEQDGFKLIIHDAYHTTEAGWWGDRKDVVLPSVIVRYYETVKMQPFGEFPDRRIPDLPRNAALAHSR